MDKMREEFEKWFYDNAGLKCKFDSYDNAYVTASSKTTGDTIVNTSCCIAWESWKASRVSLCVELPDGSYCGFEGDSFHAYMCGVESCKGILDEVGVSCK